MPDQPNILFLFPDQWRWDWLECEDSPFGKVPVRTPSIDALAARGVRFTQCRTNAPLCAPARACLARGLRYERCGVPDNDGCTPTDRPTVFRLLREAGYHTATCGKSDLFKPDTTPNPTGYVPVMDALGFADGIDHRGKFDAVKRGREQIAEPYTLMLKQRGLFATHAEDYARPEGRRPPGPTPLPTDAYTDDFAGQNALKLIDRAPADRPWCLWVNFPGPHNPFDPPAEAFAPYADVDFPPPINPAGNSLSDEDVARERRLYAACCSHLDAWVGRLLARVEARGELANTLVVFASDHGEMLGDHGRWNKGVPQEGSVRVPLIVAGPGVRPGATSGALVELIDVAATLLDVAGIPAPGDWDARSVDPLLRGETDDTSHREVQVSALGKWQLACDGRFKLVRVIERDDRLYDLCNDPAELHDVATEHPDVTALLGEALEGGG